MIRHLWRSPLEISTRALSTNTSVPRARFGHQPSSLHPDHLRLYIQRILHHLLHHLSVASIRVRLKPNVLERKPKAMSTASPVVPMAPPSYAQAETQQARHPGQQPPQDQQHHHPASTTSALNGFYQAIQQRHGQADGMTKDGEVSLAISIVIKVYRTRRLTITHPARLACSWLIRQPPTSLYSRPGPTLALPECLTTRSLPLR